MCGQLRGKKKAKDAVPSYVPANTGGKLEVYYDESLFLDDGKTIRPTAPGKPYVRDLDQVQAGEEPRGIAVSAGRAIAKPSGAREPETLEVCV
jgi:hypothetical protein